MFIRDSLPPGGLFAGMEWKVSPAPFPPGENHFANHSAQS
jgi:hypothetical protein